MLNLLKPPGMTSHDAVAAVRRLFGERRVGHAGTLDPDATGVLVICIGSATKAIQFMEGHDKAYCAVARLGRSTDTLDAAGVVTAEAEPGWTTTPEAVRRALSGLSGEIQQVPPMVSALHHDGKRLYELARAGIEVQRPARTVLIRELDADRISAPPGTSQFGKGTIVRLFVRCSKGTYVRSLVDDLGQRLGGGAYLEFLVRTASGPFTIEGSWTFEALASRSPEGRSGCLLPPQFGLVELPVVELDSTGEDSFRHGRELPLGQATLERVAGRAAGLVRVVGPEGVFLGVGELGQEKMRAVRVFV